MNTDDSLESTVTDRPMQAYVRAERLSRLLSDEFEALKAQNIDQFEALQPGKADLLTELSVLTGISEKSAQPVPGASRLEGAEWDEFKQLMGLCRDAHHRNEILISRQLDAIRGTISALQGATEQATVEVYDRLGKLNRVKRARGYNEA